MGGASERQEGYREDGHTLLGFELFSTHTGGHQVPSGHHSLLYQSWEVSQECGEIHRSLGVVGKDMQIGSVPRVLGNPRAHFWPLLPVRQP